MKYGTCQVELGSYSFSSKSLKAMYISYYRQISHYPLRERMKSSARDLWALSLYSYYDSSILQSMTFGQNRMHMSPTRHEFPIIDTAISRKLCLKNNQPGQRLFWAASTKLMFEQYSRMPTLRWCTHLSDHRAPRRNDCFIRSAVQQFSSFETSITSATTRGKTKLQSILYICYCCTNQCRHEEWIRLAAIRAIRDSA